MGRGEQFKCLVLKELWDLRSSTRFHTLTVAVVFLVTLALFLGNGEYRDSMGQFRELQRMADKQMGEYTVSDVFQGNMEAKGFRPPASASVLCRGMEGTVPQQFAVTEGGIRTGFVREGRGGNARTLERIDLLFVVQVVLSLALILLAYDAISGERENGTLGLVLANPLPRDMILTGKLVAGVIALGIALLVAFATGAVVLLLGGFPLFSELNWIRYSLLYFAAVLYGTCFFCMGLAVSVRSSKSNSSLITLLLVWVALVFLFPGAGGIIAELVRPVPPRSVAAMNEALVRKTLAGERDDKISAVYADVFAGIPQDLNSQVFLTANEEFEARQAELAREYWAKEAAELSRLRRDYNLRNRRQEALAERVSRISPAVCLSRFATGVCGTGELMERRFWNAMHAFSNDVEEVAFHGVYRGRVRTSDQGTKVQVRTLGKLEMPTLPRFSYGHPALDESLAHGIPDMLVLLISTLGWFLVAFISFRRCEVMYG